MNKILYVIFGLVVAALLVGSFFIFKTIFAPQAPVQTTTGTTVPITYVNTTPSDTAPVQTNDTISLPSAFGGTIQVDDFKTDPAFVKDPVNPGYYYLGYHFNEGVSDPTATDTPPYVIQYTDNNQSFNIALYEEPIGQVRQEAEQYLMAHLGISQNQMCQLKYTVGVPARVDATYAGIVNLGFSFCPGATVLPAQ